jgi:hypothetical protein
VTSVYITKQALIQDWDGFSVKKKKINDGWHSFYYNDKVLLFLLPYFWKSSSVPVSWRNNAYA